MLIVLDAMVSLSLDRALRGYRGQNRDQTGAQQGATISILSNF